MSTETDRLERKIDDFGEKVSGLDVTLARFEERLKGVCERLDAGSEKFAEKLDKSAFNTFAAACLERHSASRWAVWIKAAGLALALASALGGAALWFVNSQVEGILARQGKVTFSPPDKGE